MGVLSTLEEQHDRLISVLEENFGPVEESSPVMDFSFTDYYDAEMGGRPVRYLLMFRDLVDPGALADIKTLTNELEKQFAAEGGGRRVNLDPGTLSLANLILATCKDRSIPIQSRLAIFLARRNITSLIELRVMYAGLMISDVGLPYAGVRPHSPFR